ncbi:hypothetical protein Kpol_1036p34a [Vanderwaltozyma polyspora DSM 70294]|uniref:Chitin synthase n=1 Tax=Vanderwaltozyma polyspora (strain ATCC 22028 / DSM 70294 / BCRC 21397 / CBS 2163 / NBRC 10782 / NRRL Y-8283 / UCD 57-17) TaxID=436907 RepID=A7TEI4_VANPO|nr:uncharacterized protein Kpol_1036p34a [Vanderwaltozyma polyspora DSM 70294]EDO19291.1 hypothetical protein Kpol_1036p34a [Vanderwaltozyma polyspora DSM 70294]
MTRNPFVADASGASPIRSPRKPNLTRFSTHSSEEIPQWNSRVQEDPFVDESEFDHSHRFQGLPQSPSKAALRYSPERRQRNQFYRDSTHNTPVANRYLANLQQSPTRPTDAVIEMEKDYYGDDIEEITNSYLREDTRTSNNLFGNVSRTYTQYSASMASTAAVSYMSDEKMRKSFDSEKDSIFSGDTFGETKFQLNHPVRRDYVRRANSESKRRTMTNAPTNKAILKLDNPIPRGLLDSLPRRSSPEFTEMRYTACTVESDDFASEGYSLRFAEMNRECQIVVCVTMYNEDKYALARTLHSIMRNVAHLCKREKSHVWGPNGWKKVSVILISDGRAKVNQGSLDYLAALGVYQEDMAKASVNGESVKAHIFELTTQLSINAELDYVSEDIVPVQLIFCLKEENKKKINSHRWLFNSFCPVLQPNVVMLVDVGTQLNDTAVYHLWKAFDLDSNVAGAAGQIIAMKGKHGKKLLNPLVASQNFEYKISNILDKPLESTFGYISVLPGALSAYRYRALQNHEDGTGPLNSYFLGESLEGRNENVFTANMYLAEDRILCWELVAKRDSSWVLKYVKEAKGETDVPEDIPEFISQRRRWLNGATFAALYAQLHFYQIWETNHSFLRKIFLHVEFFYQFVQMLFSWFAISNFVLTFYYLAGSLNHTIKHGVVLFIFFKYLIFCDLACLFIISMGNRPQGGKYLFITSICILTVCALYALICGFVFAFKTLASHTESYSAFVNIVVSLLSTYGLYTFASVMYLDPWHMITSSVQYFATLPAFTCTLQIFAFCNTHDVSWGTKGSTQVSKPLSNAIVVQGPDGKQIVETDWPQEVDKKYIEIKSRLKEVEVKEEVVDKVQKKNDYYRDIRTRIVMFWLLSNLILIMAIIEVYSPDDTNNKYLQFILWSVAALALFRVTGSMAFLFVKYLRAIVSYFNKREISDSSRNWKIPEIKIFSKSG